MVQGHDTINARAPAESRGPPFQRSVGGPMGPGLRRESVLVALSCTARRQRRVGD